MENRIEALLGGWQEHNEALALATSYVEENPQNAIAYHLLGRAWRKVDLYEPLENSDEYNRKAIEAFTKSIQLGENSHRNYKNLGECYINLKEYEKALYYVRMAIDRSDVVDADVLKWEQLLVEHLSNNENKKTNLRCLMEIDERIAADRADWYEHNGWIAAGHDFVVALDPDGYVAAAGPDRIRKIMSFNDIVAVDAGTAHCVALTARGTAVAAGLELDGRCNVFLWSNLVWVCAGGEHTVGLRKDGSVVATGSNKHGQCDVSHWKDVVFIAAGGNRTVGITKDGKILFAGNFSDWTIEKLSKVRNPVIVCLDKDSGFDTYAELKDASFPYVHCWSGTPPRSPGDTILSIAENSKGIIIKTELGVKASERLRAPGNLVAFSFYGDNQVGLTEDGEVIQFGEKRGDYQIPNWPRLFDNFQNAIDKRNDRKKQATDASAAVEMNYDAAAEMRFRELLSKEDYLEAYKFISNYAEKDPNNALVWQHMGNCLISCCEPQKAIDAYSQSLQLGEYLPESYYNISRCYISLEKYDEALAYLDKAIEQRGDDLYFKKRGELREFLEAMQREQEEAKNPWPENEKKSRRICKNCGSPVAEKSEYCLKCGVAYKKTSVGTWALAIIAIVAAIIVPLFYRILLQ